MSKRGVSGNHAGDTKNKAFGAGRFFDEKREKMPALHRYSLLIFALLCFAYLVSGSAAMEVSFFDLSGNVVYRGQSGVALVCPVRWDAKSLDGIVKSAEQEGVSITFFVSPDWAEKNAERVQRIREKHEIYLLGSALTREGLETERQRFESLGLSTAFYMPADDADANTIARYADEYGMRVVLSSFDVLSRSSNSKDAVERMSGDAFEGAIVRFEPTAIMERALPEAIEGLRERGFEVRSLTDLLGDTFS